MANLEEFLTVKEAAELLGVASNTIRNWDRDGKIPVYRHPLSRYRLFKRQDLEELLKQIEESGQYPTGWPKPKSNKRKPK